jgi:tRNA-splicing ligase RtcB
MPAVEDLKKISDTVWEIPTSYKTGMRVPARLYATENLIRDMDEGVIDQITNVAMLPGIVKAAMCMPDGHWGYGFPIGGVAAMDAETGVISPGGIGFDINCLPADALILHEFGYRRPIAALDQRWQDARIVCAHPKTDIRPTRVAAFLKQSPPRHPVLRITTRSGRTLAATGDHPVLTPRGMVPLKDITRGDVVSVYPFEGLSYEAPSDEFLVTEQQLRDEYPGHANGFRQVVRFLTQRGLLPLRMNHPKLPYLVKLLGFTEGDGTLHFLKGGGSLLAFYGEPIDLEAIRRDVKAIGFSPSRIYRRRRSHAIRTRYGLVEFDFNESSVHVGATGLALLLHCLGATAGQKAAHDVRVPQWLERAPRWMKRLYLAALFGAELSAPKTITGHPYNFYGPVLSVNKQQRYAASGQRYLRDIQQWLIGFSVKSALLEARPEDYVNKRGQVSARLRLQISSEPENLIRLWSQVGFEYNRRKQHLANVAMQYLREKTLVLQEREASIPRARQLRRAGLTLAAITAEVGSPHVNMRFIARSLWEPRKTAARVSSAFPSFEQFRKERTRGLGKTGQVWDTVTQIQPTDYRGPVYDVTVEDTHHNFIADSFVVSNCGMRLVTTNLTYDEVKPHLRQLVDLLFQRVPAGVGSSGFIKLSPKEFRSVVERGAKWSLSEGMAWPEDLERTEEHGCIEGADSETISKKAVERGMDQVGTLGSGNHYLEIQVAKPEHVHDATIAERFGITIPNQVVVMYHCGSRGFGHQVATDYLQVFLRAMPKYGLSVPDRELACAPFRSPEGQDYFAAMRCAINMSFANRQVILHRIREVFSAVLGRDPRDLGMQQVYDVAHNTAKLETHFVDGKPRRLLVHRKGSTRAFAAGMEDLPKDFADIGQPVIVGGSMETGSYLLVGIPSGAETFYSTAHGSGRTMSRARAKKLYHGRELQQQLEARGIYVRSVSYSGLAEEAGGAYKNIDEVVEATERAGISRRVVRFTPIGNVKG